MRSKLIEKYAKFLMKKDKKGQVGLDTAKAVIFTLLSIVIGSFVVIVALASLNNSTILPSGSLEKNQTSYIIANVSTGITSFFSNTGVWFSLLAIVVVILILGIVLIAVNRYGGETSGGL